MLGKASEIKISDPLRGADSVRGWMINHMDHVVFNILTTTEEGYDYFYIIYKEGESL